MSLTSQPYGEVAASVLILLFIVINSQLPLALSGHSVFGFTIYEVLYLADYYLEKCICKISFY